MTAFSDVAAAAGLVTREVRTGSRDGTPTRIAIASRTYRTDTADLWDALTNPERLPRWFAPVSGDLVLGGTYQVEGNAGGTVERCDEPTSFAVTWEMGPQVSWLEISLTAADDGTELRLTHEAAVDPTMWNQFGPGAVGIGWDLGLLGLGIHLDTGAPVDRSVADVLHTTPEGKSFIRGAADGWAAASIADGDQPDEATAAADRSYGFYTTEPE